jgi:hypothetical protein
MAEIYALGTAPLTGDTRRILLVKWLTQLQHEAGALAHNNPTNTDTVRTLLTKIDRAKNGI